MFNDDVPVRDRIYRGERVSLLVLGRALIAGFSAETPYIVISVTDPERPAAAIPDSPKLLGVLRLKFHDNARTVDVPGLEGLSLGAAAEEPMTEEDARAVLSFVRERLDHVELIVCQCEAGVSRSAAIAAALSRILQNDDRFFFANYWPNQWVYRTILAAEPQEPT